MLFDRLKHPLWAFVGATVLTLPWLSVWATGQVTSLGVYGVVGVSGLAVLGASFLLAWGAETAEKDVPRAFALAVLAVLAVAPEYAVDALYAWNAGQGVEGAGDLAVANMTGANRILIGLGWSGIALFSIYKARQTKDQAVITGKRFIDHQVRLDPSIATEITFLFLATLFAFLVPLGGGIGIVDMLVLVGLYVAYILLILTSGIEEEEAHIGVPAYFQSFIKRSRVAIVLSLFVYSGLLILTAVEPFAHGLEEIGIQNGIDPFLMIQWVAPLASESPELIVTAYLVNKARSTAAFNALISSKLNQWTLLIGTLVVVYSISLGTYGVLAFEQKQAGEIWLTAAQSLFAISILVNFHISVKEAVALLVLFTTQLHPSFHDYTSLLWFSALYIVLALVLFWYRRDDLQRLLRMTTSHARGERYREPDAPEPAK